MEFFQNISNMLFPSFDKNQAKVLLRGAVIRIKMLRGKTTEKLNLQKREILNLYQNGKEELARIRVEHIINDTEFTHALELLELFCEKLQARLDVIQITQNVPEDMLETVHSLVFAAPRVSQIQELTGISGQLTLKYGKEYVEKISHHGSHHVNVLLSQKLAIKTPDPFVVQQYIHDIVGHHHHHHRDDHDDHQQTPPPPSNYNFGGNATPPVPNTNAVAPNYQYSQHQPPVYQDIQPPNFPPPPYNAPPTESNDKTGSFPPLFPVPPSEPAPQEAPKSSSVESNANLDLDDLTARFEALKKKTQK